MFDDHIVPSPALAAQIKPGELVSNNEPGAQPGTADEAHLVTLVHITFTDHDYTDVTVAASK